ncbi:hypothetical protein [Streptomyces sp.]|uniref:hypothetical protein n=1 Tax=Streptomyces sp. TaxID=1931 RepID=UPI0028119468|nr:hypothetical protein [Streptomyces sp.]
MVTGEAAALHGGHDRPAGHGMEIVPLDDPGCATVMRESAARRPQPWNENVGDAGD